MNTQRGLAVSTHSIQAIECINHFHHEILSSGQSIADILEAARLFPDNLLIQTYAAVFYLYAQENSATKQAAKYLIAAEKQLATANLREKLTYQAVCAWHNLDYEGAITIFTAITKLYPRDTLALKFAEWLFYCTGQAYQAQRFLSLCEAVAKDNQDESHFLAIHSFALELCGQRDRAKMLAEKAIVMNWRTPWAHHTLAHIYLLNNAISEGITCLQQFKPSWDSVFPLVKGHNIWHLALFHLANRNETETVKLFNQAIFSNFRETIGVQIDAISLLWRMDMAGLAQDQLFQSVITYLGEHPYEQYTGFNNVHFMYCLARNGKSAEVNHALKSIENYIHSLPKGSTQTLWYEVILPFCKAISAFAQTNYQEAQILLESIIHRCLQLGGSDAQDELFMQTYLFILLRNKKKDQAKQFFSQYLSHYKNTELAEHWFSM